MKLYIAGPMTHQPGRGYSRFVVAAERLRENGYDVVSPVELNVEDWLAEAELGDEFVTPEIRKERLKKDIAHLVHCDGICHLPGWANSKGAQLEVGIGDALGLPKMYLHEWEAKAIRDGLRPQDEREVRPGVHGELEQDQSTVDSGRQDDRDDAKGF